MVAKPFFMLPVGDNCIILAKKYMVAKLKNSFIIVRLGIILAKKHMVAKPQIHININLINKVVLFLYNI